MRGSITLLVALAVALAAHGCGRSPTAPSVPTTTTLAPAPASVTTLRIAAVSPLSAIGETRQLTATAGYSDGTSRDVTSETQWTSRQTSIVTVSTTGLLTAVGFGRASVEARYSGRLTGIDVMSTPPGTFVAFGRTREPGLGGLGDVRVSDPRSGAFTLTSASSGEYSIGGLTNTRLVFEKNGYEPVEHEVLQNLYTDLPLQRTVRLAAGDSVTPPDLAPNDMDYRVGADLCEPCRMIRITISATGTLRLTLGWKEARVRLSLWAQGRRVDGEFPELTANVPVAPGELRVHVGFNRGTGGLPGLYIPFTLSATVGS